MKCKELQFFHKISSSYEGNFDFKYFKMDFNLQACLIILFGFTFVTPWRIQTKSIISDLLDRRHSIMMNVGSHKHSSNNRVYFTKNESNIEIHSGSSNFQVLGRDLLYLGEMAFNTVEDVALHLRRSWFPSRIEESNPKERMIVIGSGWSAHALLKIINTDRYHVTCISPRPYFIFTPMLASTAVGTVEYRSIVEPIRIANPLADYVEGEVVDFHLDERLVTVASKLSPHSQNFNISYDKLVYAAGVGVASFGIKGVEEHCHFIKEIDDVRKIKERIFANFEAANLPQITPANRKKLLTFAIVGGGPTGVEFCGELSDFVREEVARVYPSLLSEVKIILINSGSNILSAFDSALQDAALLQLQSSGIEIQLNSKVLEIEEGRLRLKTTIANERSSSNFSEIDFGLCVWAAGTATRPITSRLGDKLGKDQVESIKQSGRLLVDPYMRVVSKYSDSLLAMGDCCVTGAIQVMALPQTAQVAAQEGAYVARLLNRLYDLSLPIPTISNGDKLWMPLLKKVNHLHARPFNFLNLGLLAYIGGSQAVASVQIGQRELLNTAGEKAYILWKSVYLVKQVSLRTRVLVLFDFFKTRVFGRDISGL